MSARKVEPQRKPAAQTADLQRSKDSFKIFLLSLALAIATVVVYFPVTRFEFINYDDPGFVTENRVVQQGLSLHGFAWAFALGHGDYWHPLTWLSHMLDCTMFGLNPSGPHAVNLAFHVMNSVLLFLVFYRISGAVWRGAFAATLFALHPLHVESVAWIAERKDVLSTFLFLLTLWFYAVYVERAKTKTPNSKCSHYSMALACFALGLMAKPILVTLPFILLLLDYGVFGRLQIFRPKGSAASNFTGVKFGDLLREKIPFFVLMFISIALTFSGQFFGEKVGVTVNSVPFWARCGNAAIAYVRYLKKTAWPNDLAVFYPLEFWPLWQVIGAAVLLVLISVLALRLASRIPYLITGWLWFLGTLIPVIGLVQSGAQSMADRYSYISLIGIFFIVSWGGCHLLRGWAAPRWVLAVVAGGVVLACSLVTTRQLRFWQNSLALFEHAIAVTRNNAVAHTNLGIALRGQKRMGEAKSNFLTAESIDPNNADTQLNLGNVLIEEGNPDEALPRLQKSLELKPSQVVAHNDLANLLARKGDYAAAEPHYREAIRLDASYADAHYNLALLMNRTGRSAEAVAELIEALKLNPDLRHARRKLAELYRNRGQFDLAMKLLSSLLESAPDDARSQFEMALLLVAENQEELAIQRLENACKLASEWPAPLNEMAWIRATSGKSELRNGTEAVQLALRACELTTNRHPEFLGTLDAAYAEAGQFKNALHTAEVVRELFLQRGETNMAMMAEQRAELYRAGKPFHLKSN